MVAFLTITGVTMALILSALVIEELQAWFRQRRREQMEREAEMRMAANRAARVQGGNNDEEWARRFGNTR